MVVFLIVLKLYFLESNKTTVFKSFSIKDTEKKNRTTLSVPIGENEHPIRRGFQHRLGLVSPAKGSFHHHQTTTGIVGLLFFTVT